MSVGTEPTREEATLQGDPPGGISTPSAVLLLALLLVFGGLVWWLQVRSPDELNPDSIKRIPLVLGDWQGKELPISDGVERMLRADAQFQREYVTSDDDLVWLYVGYYGTQRGGRPEHTPWVCYPSAGWAIEKSTELATREASAESEPGTLNELLVEQAGNRRLVHFWYQTHRRSRVATETGLTIDHVVGRLSSEGRADGALVRLSTPIEFSGIDDARDRLRRFAAALDTDLGAHWPR